MLESSPYPEARELLRAGIAEAPRSSARRAAALALGVGAGVSVTSAASAASVTGAVASSAGATGAVAGTAGATAIAAPSLALVVGKWVALGTLAGVTLAGGANLISARFIAPATAPPLVQTNPQPSLPLVPRVAERTMAQVASAQPTDQVPVPASASHHPAPVHSARLVAGPSLEQDVPSRAEALLPNGRDLGREVAEIDAARQAVAAGNARAALRHLEQYSALPRTGTLEREAQLLRIDALLLIGNKAEGLELARAYLARHPVDPHSTRLRALVKN